MRGGWAVMPIPNNWCVIHIILLYWLTPNLCRHDDMRRRGKPSSSRQTPVSMWPGGVKPSSSHLVMDTGIRTRVGSQVRESWQVRKKSPVMFPSPFWWVMGLWQGWVYMTFSLSTAHHPPPFSTTSQVTPPPQQQHVNVNNNNNTHDGFFELGYS